MFTALLWPPQSLSRKWCKHWRMWIFFRRCTTCVITSAIGTSLVWRARCPQTSSWTNGRAAPSLTWRTSLGPAPVCQNRWGELPQYRTSHSRTNLSIHLSSAYTYPVLTITCFIDPPIFPSLSCKPPPACRMHRGYGSQTNVPLLLWEHQAPVACLHSAQQTTAATQVRAQAHTATTVHMWESTAPRSTDACRETRMCSKFMHSILWQEPNLLDSWVLGVYVDLRCYIRSCLNGAVVKYLKGTLKDVKILKQHNLQKHLLELVSLDPWEWIFLSLQGTVWTEEWPPPAQERRTSPTETGGTTRREASSPKWPQTSWERGSSSICRWESVFSFPAHQSWIITRENTETGQ